MYIVGAILQWTVPMIKYSGHESLRVSYRYGALGGKAGEPMRLEDNETWDRVIGANLTGPFHVTRAVWRHMVAGGGGFMYKM